MSQDELIRKLQGQVATLAEQVRLLQLEISAEPDRPSASGRERHSLWGTLDDELPAGGSADVTIKRRSVSGGGWETLWTMEDVLAPPLMSDGTCLPSDTWVEVSWFPADQERFVTGAKACPSDCATSSSSGS
jgi:hypothetical protein